jgi:hypothetical protein
LGPAISLLRAAPAGRTGGKRDTIDRVVQARLDWELPTLRFDDVAFSDAADFLRDVSGSKIDVNWNAIDAAGIQRGTPIRLHVGNRKFSMLLAKVLDSVGVAYTFDVPRMRRNNGVSIGTHRSLMPRCRKREGSNIVLTSHG